MIFGCPASDEPIDQGDIIDGCPILAVTEFDPSDGTPLRTKHVPTRIVVLTQTCDLANLKAQRAAVAVLYEARALVDQGLLKVSDIRGPIRQGRVYG